MTLSLHWIALFLAVPALLFADLRWTGFALLVLAYGAALIVGQLSAPALLVIALLAVAAYAISPRRSRLIRIAGHALFIALAIGLGLHAWPGFHNERVIVSERMTPDALPFTMFLNLDKPLTGFWLLLALPGLAAARRTAVTLNTTLLCVLPTAVACLCAAQLLGVVHWAPKLPPDSILWALNNLLLVSFAEEALFRAYLQGGLTRLLAHDHRGEWIALCMSAVLFGLAHAAGGWQWIVLATIAGAGYGVAYRYGGLRAAVLTHFGLNAAHFFLFTYPMLQAHPGVHA
ncbi:CPBP family intramembrane glutamic endopeptidase [Caballeronia sp. LZ035]|uniref:CPBP family intramembrane glutamic endopeptidase n=1 Tax=Caballeronia sp. LZ035 TaxID=3038568 RepID=UPI002859F6CD|nr:CPBP family intramembrane glutamic endopeptidase [Caballeronia sp. LZ035]MDR5760076.1 CPBP family intramembrane metalloprotease [Caballeronia sp. LZ035]